MVTLPLPNQPRNQIKVTPVINTKKTNIFLLEKSTSKKDEKGKNLHTPETPLTEIKIDKNSTANSTNKKSTTSNSSVSGFSTTIPTNPWFDMVHTDGVMIFRRIFSKFILIFIIFKFF